MTPDGDKTEAELLQELETLRHRISELEQTRKKAEQELKKYQFIVESAQDAIFFKDLKSRYIVANNKVLEAFALPREKVIGKNDYEIMPNKEEAKKNIEDDQLVFKTGKVTEITKQMTDASGKKRWFHGIKVPQFDDNRKIIGLVGIARDITEYKKADESLRESEEKYRKLFEETTDAIFVADAETGIMIDCNRAASELVGSEKSELIGKHQRILHPPQEIEGGFSKTFKQHLAEKKGQILDAQVITKKGEIKDVAIRASQLEIKGEKRIQGLFRDITDRKKAEEKLRKSEEKYRVLYETIKDGIAGGPMDGRITECNQAFADMLGYSKDELKNLTYQQITPKRWHQMEDKIVKEQILKRGYSDEYEKQYIRKDGTVFPISARVWLRTDKDGKPLGMWGMVRDVTERKKAEQALRESQSWQRAILDSIPDIAWLKDKDSRYIAANEALCKAFGIKLEDIIGKTDFDISPKDLAERYRTDDREVMKSGKRKRVEELWGKKESEDSRKPVPSRVEAAGSQRIWIETIKTPIYDDKGQVIGTSGIARDITERKKAEEELRQYHEKMARAERLASIGTLSATMAHQLNQPLTVINLSIENALAKLENTACPPALGGLKEALKDALSGVSHATSIVNGFRNYARKSSAKIAKEVNLKAVAERTVRLLSESAQRARVTLSLKGMEKLPTMYFIEENLEQLFFALAENAIQAADGKKERQLVISGAVKGRNIELEFADNCSGIAPENIDRLFEPFFTTRPADQRTGLGLCIVEHIVSQAGGKVRVESKVGEGTRFYVTIPININIK